MSQPKLSIIIPCFNEARNVTMVLNQFHTLLSQTQHTIEVIVIDGGSTDNTAIELTTLFENLNQNQFKLILREKPGGYGADIMHALAHATGDVLAWTHADQQTDPADVIKAYELYLKCSTTNERVFIKGMRKNRRFLDLFFTFGMQLVVLCVLKQYLSDINAQPKLFSREFYKNHLSSDYPLDFSLDLYAVYKAKKQKYAIKTLPVYFAKREHGQAKGGSGSWKNRITLIKRTLAYIMKLKHQI